MNHSKHTKAPVTGNDFVWAVFSGLTQSALVAEVVWMFIWLGCRLFWRRLPFVRLATYLAILATMGHTAYLLSFKRAA